MAMTRWFTQGQHQVGPTGLQIPDYRRCDPDRRLPCNVNQTALDCFCNKYKEAFHSVCRQCRSRQRSANRTGPKRRRIGPQEWNPHVSRSGRKVLSCAAQAGKGVRQCWRIWSQSRGWQDMALGGLHQSVRKLAQLDCHGRCLRWASEIQVGKWVDSKDLRQ